MDVRQLGYFVTVAELRHFGKAAQRLHIVQPAVSQQIARLERELGLTLFDRSHRQIALTADGEAFLPHARRVLRALDSAANAAADLAAGAAGLLRVGSSEGLGPRLDQILAAFRLQHPSAIVQLSVGTTPAKLAAVAAGDLDAAFVRAPEEHSGVRLHHLWNEPLLLALPVGYPGDPVELSALADLPLAQTPREHNPGMFDLVVAACRAAGFSPKAGPQLGSMQDLLAGPVAAGHCWTVLYAATAPPATANVRLPTPDPALTVPTSLAVADPTRRTLVNDFVTVARTATPDTA